MNPIVENMLKRYACHSQADYEQALKEIIQEIALLGLWRAKFYEKAAFCGGSALRILHGLDRFSEDLDFTLLRTDSDFSLSHYESAVAMELKSYGFDVTVESKTKRIITAVESAFIKADTMIHFIKIGAPFKTHKEASLKVKFEVDTSPPAFHLTTDVVQHFNPIPFSVKTLRLPDLFAGKIHAILSRDRITNVKGRDWHDFLWFISRNVGVNLEYLKCRLEDTKYPVTKDDFSVKELRQLLIDRLGSLDLNYLIKDVSPFVRDRQRLDAWSKELFLAAIGRLNSE